MIRALLILCILPAIGVGCDNACEQLSLTLCERMQDDSQCQEWKEVASNASNETCQKSLDALSTLPE